MDRENYLKIKEMLYVYEGMFYSLLKTYHNKRVSKKKFYIGIGVGTAVLIGCHRHLSKLEKTIELEGLDKNEK